MASTTTSTPTSSRPDNDDTDLAATAKGIASDVADRAVAAAQRLPEAATATGVQLERANQLIQGESDEVLAVGTSLGVYPAAALPEYALRAGATLAVLNGEPTPFDGVAEFVIRDRLGEVLPDLVARV